MKRKLVSIAALMVGMQCSFALADGPPFSMQDVPKDGGSIVLDGKIGAGEWNGTKLQMSWAHGQTREGGAADGTPIPCEESGVCNSEPLQVSIQYAWDDTSLYYLVEETVPDDDPTTGVTAGDWCHQCTNVDAVDTEAAPWSTDSVGFYTTGINWTPDSDEGEFYNTLEMGPLIQPWVGLTAAEDLVIDGKPQYRHLARAVNSGFGEAAAQLIGPEHEPHDSYIDDLDDRWDLTQPQSAFGETEDGRRVVEMFMRWDQLFYNLEDPDDFVQERLETLEADNPGVTELLNTSAVKEGLEFRMDPLLVDGVDEFTFGSQTHPSGNEHPQVTNGADEFSDISVLRLTAATNPTLSGDFDGDGDLDGDDIESLSATIRTGAGGAQFDVDGSGAVDADDRAHWVNVLSNTYFGDANLDGEFNSSDFVAVFTPAKYETGQPATWAEGDWSGDGIFDSSDFVTAFTASGYEKGPRPAGVPEPTTISMLVIAALSLCFRRKLSLA
ncbi:MAG: PEP-CTERM sorting domain-containing protein [Planctomycetales bacterium]|nr:PEP-CTERM sorting domain-containing protein [Planctomycetales bacterium]